MGQLVGEVDVVYGEIVFVANNGFKEDVSI